MSAQMPTVETLVLAPERAVPNNVLPVLVYRATVAADASAIETLFARHGWTASWRNGIYPFHHFHSTTHEVLGVARGEVLVRLGGESGRDVRLAAGDVVVLPAGIGHKRISPSPGLLIVGAYPDGRDCDVIRRDQIDATAYAEAVARIAALPLPSTDPVRGSDGPLIEHWSRR